MQDRIVTSITRNSYSETVPANTPIQEVPGIDTVLNSHGYRSDEFSSKEASDNYLFTGCSFTWGAGLPEGKSWSHILNRKLGGKKHFNLAMSGQSVSAIISNVYKYIREFGKPKAIFVYFPNLERFERFHINYEINDGIESGYLFQDPYLLHSVEWHKALGSDSDLKFINETTLTDHFLLSRAVNDIKTFEEYLSMMGIPLVWSGWDFDFIEKMRRFSCFNNYVEHNLIADEYRRNLTPENSEDEKYWFTAADEGGHPGIAENHLFADTIYKAFAEKFGA